MSAQRLAMFSLGAAHHPPVENTKIQGETTYPPPPFSSPPAKTGFALFSSSNLSRDLIPEGPKIKKIRDFERD